MTARKPFSPDYGCLVKKMLEKLPKYILQPHRGPNAETVHTRASSGRNSADDLDDIIRTALNHPLDYPPLSDWVFPGDQIAIALQANLPRPQAVVSALLDYFQGLNVHLTDILIVTTSTMAESFGISSTDLALSDSEIAQGEPPRTVSITIGEKNVDCHVHDQHNTYGLAYIAANEAAEPVYLNRKLVDADFVLPVGCATAGGADQHSDCLYPDFGSIGRAKHFAAGASTAPQRGDEIELANDTLGSFFSLQLVFSPGGSVASAFSGHRHAVIKNASQSADDQWAIEALESDESVDVVVATIEEPGRVQTWDDFCSALINAHNVSPGDGAILIWSTINQEPNRNTRKALQRQFDGVQTGKLGRRHQTVAMISAERPVFLHCHLPPSAIEDLGLGVIHGEEDVYRITQKASSGLLLRDAHRISIKSKTVS